MQVLRGKSMDNFQVLAVKSYFDVKVLNKTAMKEVLDLTLNESLS